MAMPTPSEPRLSQGRPAAVGVITRQQSPLNIEFPFEALDAFETPTPQFYVRSHNPLPQVDRATFRCGSRGTSSGRSS